MTNAFKLYLYGDTYKIIDEEEFISIAKKKMLNNDLLKKQFLNRPIHKLLAMKIFQVLKINILPVNAILIKIKDEEYPVLKTIEMIETDIEKYIFKQKKEDANNFVPYFKGSKNALLKILLEDLNYNEVENERSLNNFINEEVYTTTNITYKENKISIELTSSNFICDFNTKRIYKYKSTIVNTEGFEFNFQKNELFTSREEAIIESKKLVDEHFNLSIRNSEVQTIIVRTDSLDQLIVFWPDITTDNDYIMANDVIGTSDLAGDTKTSLLFFNECKDATPDQVKIARDVIENTMKLETINVKHL